MTIQNHLLTILPYVADPEDEQSAKEVSLRNFLHSQSDTIEVLVPARMRAEFAERARRNGASN
jgi:hypothetical protein